MFLNLLYMDIKFSFCQSLREAIHFLSVLLLNHYQSKVQQETHGNGLERNTFISTRTVTNVEDIFCRVKPETPEKVRERKEKGFEEKKTKHLILPKANI
ncbi:hypothetical protein CEXT_296581 [Caerostris extrusa]|uniref:Uncharacterized protein n=1 Tax=Caerostris extrusa TaxID=172846 RepID=A0AAV4WZH3_CAEEX|nr:hypothetical protein CEXT_296581 [Caerostris extrusa]